MKSFLKKQIQKINFSTFSMFSILSGALIFEFGEVEIIEKIFGKLMHNRIIENLIVISIVWFFSRRAVGKHFLNLEGGVHKISDNLVILTNTVSKLDKKLSFDIEILKARNYELSEKQIELEKEFKILKARNYELSEKQIELEKEFKILKNKQGQ